MKPRHALTAAAMLLALAGCTEQTIADFADGLTHTAPAVSSRAQPVDVHQARQQLAGITISPEGSGAGYSRERFPHWTTVSGCTTRETVLTEQGQGVLDDDGDCYPDAGMWVSPYDGAVWTRASDVDIDHLVPLAEAWESGAARWTEQRREAFANDLGEHGDGYPQLVAVTDTANASKGQRDPAEYRPPLTTYRCAYAAMWIDVKATWRLTADPAEVDALDSMLGTCDTGGAR